MKKLVLSLTLVAFAVGLQAGETKVAKDQTASGKAAVKAATTADTKAQCPASAQAKADAECSPCCKGEAKKQIITLKSPKDAAQRG